MPFPTVDLSTLAERGAFEEPRVEPHAEYTRLAERIRPLLPPDVAPEPGMQLGPLRGTARGTFGPITARYGWEVLVRSDALARLRAAGIRGLMPVRAELQGLEQKAPALYELELPVAGLLHRDVVFQGPRCRTCGWNEVRIAPEGWLDGDSLPPDLDVFRPANATTYTVASERFVDVVRSLEPSDVVFRELVVIPDSRSSSLH